MYTFILSARRKWSPNLVTLRRVYSWECLSKRYSAYCCIINQMPSLFAYSVCFSSFQCGRFLIRVPAVSSCLMCFDLQISSFVIKVQHTTRLLRPWILLKFVNIAFYLFFARMLHFLNKNTVGFYGKALKKCVLRKGWGIILVLRHKD